MYNIECQTSTLPGTGFEFIECLEIMYANAYGFIPQSVFEAPFNASNSLPCNKHSNFSCTNENNVRGTKMLKMLLKKCGAPKYKLKMLLIFKMRMLSKLLWCY